MTRTRPRPHRPRRKSPTPACATRRCPSARPQPAHTSAPKLRAAALTRRSPMRVTRTSLPGGAVVARSNRCRARRLADAPRSSAARSTPGRHVEVSTVGSANTASSASAGMNRHQQRQRHAEPQDPSAGREQRHVHVIEHEHLIAQHGEPVQIFRTLVMSDGGDRSLQPGHVRFQRHGHAVAKAALRAVADDAAETRSPTAETPSPIAAAITRL